MKTLYFDCLAGISGDMTIGALLDAGLDFQYLESQLARLGLSEFKLLQTKVDRAGINSTKFEVVINNHSSKNSHKHEHTHHSHDHDHHHHGHDHDHHHHAHDHKHEHHHDDHDPGHSHHHEHRGFTEICGLIRKAGYSPEVTDRAIHIFEVLGKAEARVHGLDLEKVHFHEVGAVDSIVDIVGTSIAIEALEIRNILASPLRVGFGTINCAHGVYPVPGPAATEILKGVPVYAGDIQGEMVTPTGAAIVRALASDFGHLPALTITATGYGAGTRTYEKFPNVLRVVMGESDSSARSGDRVTILETNVDDVSPQVLGHLLEKAFEAGALDVFYQPVLMKKNRPGTLVSIICLPDDFQKFTSIVFEETNTLGIRYREESRVILTRNFVEVATPFGNIRMKVRTQSGVAVPEFDDCRAAANRHGVALQEVQLAAIAAYKRS